MRSFYSFIAVCALMALAACGTTVAGVQTPPAPKTPSQALYEAHVAFDIAVKQADTYAKLPRCATNGPAVCSTTVMAQSLYSIATKTQAGLNAADTAVATYTALASPTATDLQKALAAVSAATEAVQQFTGATTVLQQKG